MTLARACQMRSQWESCHSRVSHECHNWRGMLQYILGGSGCDLFSTSPLVPGHSPLLRFSQEFMPKPVIHLAKPLIGFSQSLPPRRWLIQKVVSTLTVHGLTSLWPFPVHSPWLARQITGGEETSGVDPAASMVDQLADPYAKRIRWQRAGTPRVCDDATARRPSRTTSPMPESEPNAFTFAAG